MFRYSQTLPFEHSIFFLGLLNFNIILFLLLFFLIFRNIVKIFAERPRGILGASLKSKLVAAFVTFSFVPTTLMFIVSVFYINNSFDKWFSDKMAGVLKSSLEVTNAYYVSARKKNYHFAARIAETLKNQKESDYPRSIESLREAYSLDAVEYYPSLFGKRVVAVSKSESVPPIPPVSLEFLQRGIVGQAEASTAHKFESGDLVRVIVPLRSKGHDAAVVVSSFVPLSLITRMDDIASANEDFRESNPLEYPVKSIYLVILVLMTLVIMLGATWFGFYLARQLSVPLEVLGKATKQVARGDYQTVQIRAGSSELNQLIQNFNAMTLALEKSEKEVLEANLNLQETLARLDDHTRYMEVVVGNVSTGVVSLDPQGKITMLNRHAARLLNIDPSVAVGRLAHEVLTAEFFQVFEDMITSMRRHKVQSLGKEVRIPLAGQQVPLQMTLSLLYDERGQELGRVVTFDDMTPLLRAQRAAAWTEVARRIAHEIKNPLTPIKLCAERLQKKFGEKVDNPVFNQNIKMIVEQVDSLKELVNEFSNFARLPKSQPVLASLNQVIDETLRLFREAHKDCRFEFSADPHLPEFYFDPEQFKRVVTNLLDNAVAAVQERPEKQIDVRTQFDAPLKMVRFSVTDSGAGIPSQIRERIFEPYMTTKASGTGLGLAIVKRTVEDHNGFIRALPHSPYGTRVLIELPIIEGPSVMSRMNENQPLT